jgi:cystathionine gamma-synthase
MMAAMDRSKKQSRKTQLVQAGIATDSAYNAVVPPLYLSSTFKLKKLEESLGYEYSRTRNPTRDILAEALAELECGYKACVTASGMAALTLIVHLLNPDDLLIAPYDCYGRSYRLLQALADKGHFRLSFIDMYDALALEEAIAQEPRMVLIETPSNPVMRIADIAAISKMAKARNSECLVVCDNTFLSSILQQPLNLGADLVYHSTTKFLNGHSDIVGGAVIAKDKAVWDQLDFWANSLGLIGAPFDAYMTLRGLRTLDVRMSRAQDNAQELVRVLSSHKAVSKVYYPGLPDHAGYSIAKRQQSGFGAMISFTLHGDKDSVKKFTSALELFALAQSLGGTESLINHPATMTHVSMGPEARAKAGVTDTLLRLSIGIEDINDLKADVLSALDGV